MRYLPFSANGLQSIIYDIVSMLIAVTTNDTLLVLGTSGCIILPIIKLLTRRRIVVNFGGVEWKREKWNRPIQAFLKLTESIAVRYSDALIVDNQYLVEYVMREYSKKSLLIEYGGDHAMMPRKWEKEKDNYSFLNDEYFISISRAQPDNNIQMVIDAFLASKKILVLVSNWYSCQYGIDIKRSYSGYSNIHLIDAVYDLEKLNIIRGRSICYIHSHSMCGTAPSLVEAMFLGLPVVAFDVETNRYSTEGKARYFKDSLELKKCICRLSSDELEDIGHAMKDIADRRYRWERIVKLYEEQY